MKSSCATLALLAALSCASAVWASGASAATPLAWSAATVADSAGGASGITAVTCQSTSLCVAVDGNGNVLYSTAPASGSWSTPLSIDSGHALTAVACPSSTLCFATDNHGNVYSTTTPASSSSWTLEHIDGTTQLNGIACPSTTLCVAVDNAGDVLSSTTPTQASWTTAHVDGSNHITAVSCPTSSLCVGVDNAGNALLPASPSASSWPATQLTGDVALMSVACTSAGACVLGAGDGTVFATANVSSPPVTWAFTPIDGSSVALSAASCSNLGVCVIGDGDGNVFESDNAAGGQPGWALTPLSTGHSITAASCLTAGLCVATDSHGDAFAGTLPPPTVTTGSGSASSQTAATLAGAVNPSDATVTDCHFDYGPTTAYGSSAPCTALPSATGGNQTVGASLSGLSASTTYHFRIVASTAVATADGADATFTTPAPLAPSPSISGTPAVGSTLTCKDGVSTNSSETVAYQWLSNTVPISGATASTYVIVAADQTHHLSCQVTISGDGGSASATSGYDGVPSQSGGKVTESFVGTDRRSADSVSAPVTCSPQAPAGCTFKLTLVALKTSHHRSQTVAVGTVTQKVAAGATKTLTVSLDASGRQLLRKQRSLSVTLTVSGTVIGSLKATLQTDKLTFAQKGRRIASRRRHTR